MEVEREIEKRERKREREGGVGPPATTSNRFPPGNGVTRSTFPPSPFPLFDFQVRVAAAERGCVSEIRKKIRKYKIQNILVRLGGPQCINANYYVPTPPSPAQGYQWNRHLPANCGPPTPLYLLTH